MTTYDAIVIGTGQAGPYVTSRLAGAGMKVAVIERSAFGGTCVNTGCNRKERWLNRMIKPAMRELRALT